MNKKKEINDIESNPWLNISSEDYIGHMSSQGVQQYQTLEKIFKMVIDEYEPASIGILGCTTGNGFNHLAGKHFKKVVGVDINVEYLNECKKLYSETIPSMELILGDLNQIDFNPSSFELIHAALIFEYVDYVQLLKKIYTWLRPGGILSAVIQRESKTAPKVSSTSYQSLQKLSGIINLIDPERFISECIKVGFEKLISKNYELPGEKQFELIIMRK